LLKKIPLIEKQHPNEKKGAGQYVFVGYNPFEPLHVKDLYDKITSIRNILLNQLIHRC
jgi:hypothetical protein